MSFGEGEKREGEDEGERDETEMNEIVHRDFCFVQI